MSGFTTTGATVVTDTEGLSNSVADVAPVHAVGRRHGIIVLFLAVLPRLRVGGRQIFEHELPGPRSSRSRHDPLETARRFVALYSGCRGPSSSC